MIVHLDRVAMGDHTKAKWLLDRISGLFTKADTASKQARGQKTAMSLLADSLKKAPEGWVIGAHSISRNGVELRWDGQIDNPNTIIEVRMDLIKFPVARWESAELKAAIQSVLAAAPDQI
jgi:hypothetical protein